MALVRTFGWQRHSTMLPEEFKNDGMVSELLMAKKEPPGKLSPPEWS